MLFLVYKLASYSFLVCACTMSCSYSLVLVVSSAVAFPTVSMLTTPSTKSSLSRSSAFLLVFFFFSFTRCFNCFLHFSSSNAKSMWPSLLIFFFYSEIPLLLREEVSECKTHYSVNCLFKGILTVMLGSFLFNKNSMTCSLKVFYIQFPQKNPNQQIKHFMQQ